MGWPNRGLQRLRTGRAISVGLGITPDLAQSAVGGSQPPEDRGRKAASSCYHPALQPATDLSFICWRGASSRVVTWSWTGRGGGVSPAAPLCEKPLPVPGRFLLSLLIGHGRWDVDCTVRHHLMSLKYHGPKKMQERETLLSLDVQSGIN